MKNQLRKLQAMQLSAEQHVKVLAAAQQYIDNSVSKTCNGAKHDTVESVNDLFRMAKDLKCKAVTYYRDESRESQVLTRVAHSNENTSVGLKHSFDYSRPRELFGSTWKIPFEGSNLYVTVNMDNGEIKELFVEGAISNAVGLLVSDMLQTGCRSPEEIARKLNKITGTYSVWFNERLITSPEQAVAECLIIAHRRLTGLPDSRKTIVSQSGSVPVNLDKSPKSCPECQGIQLEHVSGCDVCRDCGWSRCR
jgi:ribonucleoside-diphosphate reductase alpha chain